MLKIGITGGIGSGKSLICKIFEQLQIAVFNSDKAGRELILNNNLVINKIKTIFGEKIYENNTLNKQLLGQIVFNDSSKLDKLNSIIHPEVRKAFNEWVLKQSGHYVINEAAILFETSSYKNFDRTILVTAPASLRIKRVVERDNVSEQLVQDRMLNQWDDGKKIPLADFIINNDDEALVIPQVLKIHDQISKIDLKH